MLGTAVSQEHDAARSLLGLVEALPTGCRF